MQKLHEFLSLRPTKTLYHYTDAAATIGILTGKSVRASNIRHLNDSSEFTHAREWLERELDRRKEGGPLTQFVKSVGENSPDAIVPNVGRTVYDVTRHIAPVIVASFCEAENLLSQWRAYCPGGNGYALGFDATDYKGDFTEGMILVKCVYTESQKMDLCTALVDSWDEESDEEGEPEAAVMRCLAIMAALKNEAFREEQEWRLVGIGGNLEQRFRMGRHGIVPYRDVPFGGMGELTLKNIWLGPTTDVEAATRALRVLAIETGYNGIPIHDSQTPFRG